MSNESLHIFRQQQLWLIVVHLFDVCKKCTQQIHMYEGKKIEKEDRKSISEKESAL